ncbi:MAG: hypothetical protein R3Y05_02650 [bacterium]
MKPELLKGYVALAMNQSGRSTKEVTDALETLDRILPIFNEEDIICYLAHHNYKENIRKKRTSKHERKNRR